jgi:hypothetical protein
MPSQRATFYAEDKTPSLKEVVYFGGAALEYGLCLVDLFLCAVRNSNQEHGQG